MSHAELYLPIILLSISISSSPLNGILGKWDTGRGGIIEISINGDRLYGQLVSSQEPNRIDTKNPDAALRTENLVGHNILINFKQGKDHVWRDGKIYNPEDGGLYAAKLTLHGDVLKVRGYKGISLFGKTVEWTRVK
jgi:uncharacterized protein (DUF2147 family)